MTGFGDLLRSRPMCLALTGAGALHVGLTAMGWSAWPCPILACTGIRCPGCGLGTAMAQLLRGNCSAAVATHPFVPIAATACVAIIACAFLPASITRQIAALTEKLDAKMHLTAVALAALILIWGYRFLP